MKKQFFKAWNSAEFWFMNQEEKKQRAYEVYVLSSVKRTRKEIAKMVQVTEKTLREWIDKYDWDKLREARQITRPQLLQEAYAQLKAINQVIQTEYNNVPNKELSDAKAVIRKEIEAFSSQPIHRYIEVFEEFIEWLSKNEPIQINTFGTLSQRFIQELSKQK